MTSKDGFSLVEALTAIAITSIVAGVIISRTIAPRTSGEVVAIVQTISGISEAVTMYRATVGRYPSRIEDLVSLPVSPFDLCGRSIPAHFLQEWRGPYLMQRIGQDGIVVGEATVRSSIRRDPLTSAGSSNGTLFLDIANVESEVAERVSFAFDAESSGAGSMIRWVGDAPDEDRGTLVFSMPVRGC